MGVFAVILLLLAGNSRHIFQAMIPQEPDATVLAAKAVEQQPRPSSQSEWLASRFQQKPRDTDEGVAHQVFANRRRSVRDTILKNRRAR